MPRDVLQLGRSQNIWSALVQPFQQRIKPRARWWAKGCWCLHSTWVSPLKHTDLHNLRQSLRLSKHLKTIQNQQIYQMLFVFSHHGSGNSLNLKLVIGFTCQQLGINYTVNHLVLLVHSRPTHSPPQFGPAHMFRFPMKNWNWTSKFEIPQRISKRPNQW